MLFLISYVAIADNCVGIVEEEDEELPGLAVSAPATDSSKFDHRQLKTPYIITLDSCVHVYQT